ncbi:MAG TPA: ATP-dependent helicase HrpB, partial [Steroidobacteraceae bacterium]|nr:ATP-dependent helicase HrpB [Steroidobacteraceae bacterium]
MEQRASTAGVSGLPIDEALPALLAALSGTRNVVLQAPPGAGKSTVVPLALLDEPWMLGKRLIVLEPRRLAARAVAQRMAATLGEPVGRTVGWRMRFDTRVSRDTRIEVVTEGVLTRMLQSDPALEGIALVIFDEFHERSLQGDLGLALALDAQAVVAPDLRLLVMSATLDAEAIAHWIGAPRPVTASGRAFPVEARFIGREAPRLPTIGAERGDAPERLTAQAVARALREAEGDLLVFLPGAAEIRRAGALIAESLASNPAVHVFPLFGDLAAADQDAALAPARPGERKVILSTNIAETSLTVEGIRIIVDTGLVRRAVFDPATGMSRLETRRVSRASAEQRRGRAGRLDAGVCYRLWSEEAQRSLAPYTPPEIVEADLAPLALELAAWGTAELRWLDPPPAAMLASARDLLVRLGALDRSDRITSHGRQMAALALHPRLAHMLLESVPLGFASAATWLAALLSERDILRGDAADADIRSRVAQLVEARSAGRTSYAVHQTERLARSLGRQLASIDAGAPAESTSIESGMAASGLLLALAYPDRIGQRRGEGRYRLANGRGASFVGAQSLARQEFIVAIDLDDRERDARIRLAAPISRHEIETGFADRLETVQTIEWSDREQAVVARRTTRLEAIVLEEKPLTEIPPDAARAAMLDGVRRMGLEALPFNREARELQARIELVRGFAIQGGREGWPDVSDGALGATLESWLAPWLEGMTRRDHLARIRLVEALLALLTWEQRRELDALAPTHLVVPSG